METALIALVAGAVGAALTGLLQLRRDRVEALRQRQLDAADAFASAVPRVLLKFKEMLEDLPRDNTAADFVQWAEAVGNRQRELAADALELTTHTPRIELLFGIGSAASRAALQTSFDVTQAARALRSPVDYETLEWAYKLAAGSAFRFHDAVHHVVASSWWSRLRYKPEPDDAYNEMSAWLRREFGIEADYDEKD
jgi:hypothetical protein